MWLRAATVEEWQQCDDAAGSYSSPVSRQQGTEWKFKNTAISLVEIIQIKLSLYGFNRNLALFDARSNQIQEMNQACHVFCGADVILYVDASC